MENRRTAIRVINMPLPMLPPYAYKHLTCTILVISVASCAHHTASPAPSTPPEIVEKKDASPSTPPEKRKRLRPSERGIVSSVDLARVFELQQSSGALIYDARPSYLFQQGHIPGAINFPKSDLKVQLPRETAKLKAAKAAKMPILVYCSGILCSDARTVARHLAFSGYSSSVFAGGWDEWSGAGLPIE